MGKKTQNMKRLLLVRHGECEMNLHLQDKIGGQSNSSPLTELGVKQAKLLGLYFAHLQTNGVQSIGAAFSSTAIRARDTAKLALQELKRDDLTLVETDELLELNQGQWEGALRGECYTPDVLDAIAQDPWNFAAPGGESQKDVELRFRRYIEEHVVPAASTQHVTLVVAHGMAIKCFLRFILDGNPAFTRSFALDNTSITEIGVSEKDGKRLWHIVRVNDTGHLRYADWVASTQANGQQTNGTLHNEEQHDDDVIPEVPTNGDASQCNKAAGGDAVVSADAGLPGTTGEPPTEGSNGGGDMKAGAAQLPLTIFLVVAIGHQLWKKFGGRGR